MIPTNNGRPQPPPDARVYVPHAEDFSAAIKQGTEKVYCYLRNPGDDHFHLIVNGEIYLERGDEKFCLNCAMRQGFLTTDRLFWQHRSSGK